MITFWTMGMFFFLFPYFVFCLLSLCLQLDHGWYYNYNDNEQSPTQQLCWMGLFQALGNVSFFFLSFFSFTMGTMMTNSPHTTHTHTTSQDSHYVTPVLHHHQLWHGHPTSTTSTSTRQNMSAHLPPLCDNGSSRVHWWQETCVSNHNVFSFFLVFFLIYWWFATFRLYTRTMKMMNGPHTTHTTTPLRTVTMLHLI